MTARASRPARRAHGPEGGDAAGPGEMGSEEGETGAGLRQVGLGRAES